MPNAEQDERDRIGRSMSELCARRAAFLAEARRAIAAAEDIGIMQCDDNCLTQWIGTRNALVTEGICTPDQFPGGSKRITFGESISSGGIEGIWWRTTKLARGHFQYVLSLTQEETRRRYDKQCAAEREAEARGPEGEYGSIEAYTERAESATRRFKQCLLDILSGAGEHDEFGSVTLAYDRDTIRRVDSLCEQLAQTVQSGSASWTRGERTAQRNAEAARTDPRFARFLQQARGGLAR